MSYKEDYGFDFGFNMYDDDDDEFATDIETPEEEYDDDPDSRYT